MPRPAQTKSRSLKHLQKVQMIRGGASRALATRDQHRFELIVSGQQIFKSHLEMRSTLDSRCRDVDVLITNTCTCEQPRA